MYSKTNLDRAYGRLMQQTCIDIRKLKKYDPFLQLRKNNKIVTLTSH